MASPILRVSPDHEIVSTRVFNHPQQLVFEAWSNPDHLKSWWGPAGFTNTFHVFEFRVGGRWTFTMHGLDKGNYPNDCVFVVIDAPQLIVWDRLSKPIFQVEAAFEPLGDKTTLIFKMKFNSAEECNKIKPFAVEKNEENFDRLEMELSKMA